MCTGLCWVTTVSSHLSSSRTPAGLVPRVSYSAGLMGPGIPTASKWTHTVSMLLHGGPGFESHRVTRTQKQSVEFIREQGDNMGRTWIPSGTAVSMGVGSVVRQVHGNERRPVPSWLGTESAAPQSTGSVFIEYLLCAESLGHKRTAPGRKSWWRHPGREPIVQAAGAQQSHGRAVRADRRQVRPRAVPGGRWGTRAPSGELG